MKNILLLTAAFLLAITLRVSGQNMVINGDFEDNKATQDIINTTNSKFDTLMSDVNSFGTWNGGGANGGNPDIIETNNYCNYPEHGKWFVALTGSNTDAIAMTLSTPVIAGNKYALSFWDEGCNFGKFAFEVGVSTTDSTFGTIVYVASNSKQSVWVNHVDTFVATTSGGFITIHGANGDIGCWNQLDNVSLINLSAGPKSSFNMPAIVCANQSTSVSNTGSIDSSDSYVWNFGNGNVISGSGVGPYQISWATAGKYYVSLSVTDSLGNTTTTTDTVLVNAPPTATFASDSVIAAGQTDLITYTGNGSLATSSFNWNFNNAIIEDTSVNASYGITYGNPGVYSIALTVTENGCASQPKLQTIYVLSPLTAATPVCFDSVAMISLSNLVNNTGIYNWNFSGATIEAGSGAGPYSLSWDTSGKYPVSVTVQIGNSTFTYTDTVTVSNGSQCHDIIADTVLNSTGGDTILTTGIDLHGKKFAIANIYPNPTMDVLNVEFKSSTSGSVHLEVFDVIGRTVINNYKNVSSDGNSIVLNTTELPAGSYFVRITDDNANYSDTQKFIKLL